MNHRLRTAYRILILLFVLSSVYITAKHMLAGAWPLAVMGPVSLLFLGIPRLGEALLRIKLDYPLRFFIVAFSLLGYNFGTGLRWCDNVPYYDKFLHLLSGVMFTMIGLCLYAKVNREPGVINRSQKRLLQISYGFFFYMFVAVIWEMGEFAGFLLTGHDSQHHLTTGVFDTMGDLIACFLGSLVMALDFWLRTCKKRKTPLMAMVESFDEYNSKT